MRIERRCQDRTTWREWARRWWPEIGLIAAAAATRLINLGSAPYFFSDEAYAAATTVGLMRTGALVAYFFDLPMLTVLKGIPHYWLMAIAFKLLGVGVWQGRLVSALFGIGTAVVVYLLARHLFGRHAGLAALALYVFSRYALYIDRSMKLDAQAAFFALLGLYLFALAWRDCRLALMAGAGTALGMATLSKASACFVSIAVLAYLVGMWMQSRQHKRCVSALAVVGLTCALPMAGWVAYVLGARHQPPYNVPIIREERFLTWYGEELTRGVSPLSKLPVVPGPRPPPGGLKPLVSGLLRLFGDLLLRDEVRVIGLIGLLWLARRRRGVSGILLAVVAGGLVCYTFAGQQASRHLHVAYVATIIAGAALLVRIAGGESGSRRGAVVVIAVGLMCFKGFCFESWVDGMNFKPILEADTPELRAMAWIRQNVPTGRRLYCSVNIGVFSNHDYVPIQTFLGNPKAAEAFDLEYLAIDRYLAQAILKGYVEDPADHFELQKIHEVAGKRPLERVEIYRILGPRKGAKPVQWYIHRDRSFNFY